LKYQLLQGVQCRRSVNEIKNALAMPVEDLTSNNILRSALEVCNKGGHQKKTKTPFNYRLVTSDSVDDL
jgi:hypothetical protein